MAAASGNQSIFALKTRAVIMTDSQVEYVPGDAVRVIDGTWMEKQGVVHTVDREVGRVVIFFDHFGRMLPCEIENEKIEKFAEDARSDDITRIREYLFGE